MSENKQAKRSFALALGAAVIGVASIPVAAFVSTGLGIAMMAAPVFMTFMASNV